MNERIIKPGIVKRITDLTKSRNKTYTQEQVLDILNAFLDVTVDVISDGDSINLNGYMIIETKYAPERKARNIKQNSLITVPEHYKVNFKPGVKLNEAAKIFTEKQLKGNDRYDLNKK